MLKPFGNKQDYFIYSDELLLLNTLDDILFRIDCKHEQLYWKVHVHLKAFLMNNDSASYRNELLSMPSQPYKMTPKMHSMFIITCLHHLLVFI